MTTITKICKNRQEQVDLLNEVLRSQPDYKEGMSLAARDNNGDVEWHGDTSIPNSKDVYSRVLQEHLHKFQLL